MNLPEHIDRAFRNLIEVLTDLDCGPVTIKTELVDRPLRPSTNYYICDADLGMRTGSKIQFVFHADDDSVVAEFEDGAKWPYPAGGTEDVLAYHGINPGVSHDDHWVHWHTCSTDDFATYFGTLLTIEWIRACATLDRHVDLGLDSGKLCPEEVEHHLERAWSAASPSDSEMPASDCYTILKSILRPASIPWGGAS